MRRHAALLGIISLLIAGVVGIVAIHLDASPEPKPTVDSVVPVVVATAKRGDVPILLEGLGTVQAYNSVTVRTQVDGQLVKIAFREGQEVHKGDVLAQIDPRTYQAQLEQAVAKKQQDEANLSNARADLARYTGLARIDASSKQQADTQRALVAQLEAQVKADQAAIDSAQIYLSYTTVTSPIDGRTGIRQVDVGNIIHTSDANGIVLVAQLHPISVVFTLPQQDLPIVAAAVARGPVDVVALGSDNKTECDAGTLEVIDNQVDQTTGTIRLKAAFPNSNNRLWPGGFINVRVHVDTKRDAVVIPTAAVQRGPNGAYAFVVAAENTAEMRPIAISHMTEATTIVDQGLAPGDIVVIEGGSRLSRGSRVQVSTVGLSADLRPEGSRP